MIVGWYIAKTEIEGGREIVASGQVNRVFAHDAYEGAMRAGHRIELALLEMLEPGKRPAPAVCRRGEP